MEKNINFFKKVWYSISKFDKYPDMAAEGTKRAIKYLAIMVGIVTIFLVINSTMNMYRTVGELATYIENNIPEFSYSNGQITMETEEPIIISGINSKGVEAIDRIVIAPNSTTPEEKLKIKQENDIEGITIFLFKNQIMLRTKIPNEEVTELPYLYEDFIQNYTQANITEFNKAEFINFLRSEGMSAFYLSYGLVITMSLLLTNILVAFLDTFQLAIIGWITASLIKIKMKFSALFNMAVYSLTLSMILNIGYIILNCFTDFTITYFQVAYITIAYIYLAASIFILKDDFIKKKQEVEKIEKEQEKVREEILKREEEKQDEEQEDEEEKEKNKQEPKGSEA